MPESTPGIPNVEVARQRAIDDLCERFAQDLIPVDEFERRVDLAHLATTRADLDALLSDLPRPQNLPATVPGEEGTGRQIAPRPRTQVSGRAKARDVLIGMFGGSKRSGRWTPGEKIIAVGVMGGVELDFRDAILSPDVTEITAVAVMGGVEIIVPPGVHVDTGGLAIMGGFEHKGDESIEPPPDAPVIRVNGIALMGGVEVKTRLSGETHREAKRRQRAFLKNRQRRLRGGDRS